MKRIPENDNSYPFSIAGLFPAIKNRLKFNMRLFILLLIIVCNSIFFSCQKDDDYYSLDDIWISMGFIEKPANGNSFTINLDNGDTLVPVSNAVPYFEAKDNQRVMVNYTVLDEVGQSTKQFYIKINNLYDILYKDIIELTATNNDSIGNDPVHVDDIWKSNNLLNIEFSFLGGDFIHYINLVRPAGDIIKLVQPIELQLRHNAKNDLQTYRMKSIVTFDLQNIKIAGQDSVNFIVRSIDYEGNEHTFTSTYYY
jgi:hypothetical protein